MQEEMSKVSMALGAGVIVSGIYMFGFAPPGSLFIMVFLVLALAFAISASIDNAAARRRYRQKREGVENREPRLKGEPVEATPEILAGHDSFELLDFDTGNSLGTVRRALLEELIKVQKSLFMDLESNDFFILAGTPEFLQENGASKELVQLIENALAGRDDVMIRWVVA